MAVTASVTVSPRERVVQEALEARLDPSELLLGYTQCSFNPGTLADQTYYVGLTQRRFLILRRDDPGRIYSIYRSFVQQAGYTRGSLRERRGLRLNMAGVPAVLGSPLAWAARAAQLAALHTREACILPHLTTAQFLQQITDLEDLGFVRAAQQVLREGILLNPLIEIEPASHALLKHLVETRRVLWVAGGMFTLVLIFMLVMAGLGFGQVGPGILLGLAAIYALVTGNQGMRGFALVMALLAAGLNVLLYAAAGSLLEVLMWASFGLSMTIALTGRASRKRTASVIILFLLGFFGLFGLKAATGGRFPEALLSLGKAQYSDTFSGNHGWPEVNSAQVDSRVQNGVYSIHVKAPGETYFTFPPVKFLPAQVEFDAQPGETHRQQPGAYGVTCGYHADEPALVPMGLGAMDVSEFLTGAGEAAGSGYYLVAIAPSRERFAIFRQQDQGLVSMIAPAWQKIQSLPGASISSNILVRCQSGEISLSINSVEQARVPAPDLQPTGSGRMGLFVTAFPGSGPEGFQVQFDNTHFSGGTTAP